MRAHSHTLTHACALLSWIVPGKEASEHMYKSAKFCPVHRVQQFVMKAFKSDMNEILKPNGFRVFVVILGSLCHDVAAVAAAFTIVTSFAIRFLLLFLLTERDRLHVNA